MTPPGGSRDDDNAPRGTDVPGQARASAPADAPAAARPGETGSDPQLHAMRAVWREMRDEDPPDRGLANLLAAARHKAEAMQPRPSAWQRLLAALRRPPMLALATVTVLIAGAVLIGRRVPHATAPNLTASQEAAGPTRPAASDHGAGSSSGDRTAQREATAPSTEPAAGPAGAPTIPAAAAPGSAPAIPTPQPAAPPPPPPPPTALPPDHGITRPPTAHLAAPIPSTTNSPPGDPAPADDRPTTGLASEGSAPAPASRETAAQLGASAAVPGAAPSDGNNTRSFARPPRPEPETQAPTGTANNGRSDTARTAANRTANKAANNAADNAAAPIANDVAESPRRSEPAPTRPKAPGDLSRQCEAAAQRGDCATVRQLVDRISRTDRSYRARVAKDSPVGKCLAE